MTTETPAVETHRDADRTHEGLAERRRYPSDLSERQWQCIEPLLVVTAPRRSDACPLRDVADAVNYRWRTGCSWRMLPHDFPPWTTVYTHFRRWRDRGLLSDIRAAVLSTRHR
jgi:transposase